MEPISNVDRLVLLLRQRLLDRARQTSVSKGGSRRSEDGRPLTGLQQIQALAATEGIDDRQLKRALIQRVLGEHFGPELINEAKFQLVVDRVASALDADPNASKLLSGVISELKASVG